MQKVTTWLWFDTEAECGWVADRFGVSWQIVPKRLRELLADPHRDKAQRAMAAMLKMTKNRGR